MRFRTILLGCVVLGVAFRLLSVLTSYPSWDGTYYMAMGDSFSQGKELLLPYGSIFQGPIYTPVLSHHQPPLWPLVLSGFYSVAGFSLATTVAASFLMSCLVILVAFVATRDLYGTDKAWFVAAMVSFDYVLITTTGWVYAENLVAICYIGTIWAILKSLKDERYILAAGLLAGLGYLTRSSVGYFFIVAGVIGLLWRFYYMRWQVFRNLYYMGAIAIFLALVGGWALRNILAFGWPHWETSQYTNDAILFALGRPLEFALALGVKTVLLIVVYASLMLYFLPQIRKAIRNWREEAVSAHLLAIFLPGLVTVLFDASFSLYEHDINGNHIFWTRDLVRYLDIAVVPILWLALRDLALPDELRWSPGRPAGQVTRGFFKERWKRIAVAGPLAAGFSILQELTATVLGFGIILAPKKEGPNTRVLLALLVILGIASLNGATTGFVTPEDKAASYLTGIARDGDVIAVSGHMNIYAFYTPLHGVDIRFVEWNGTGADYVLSKTPITVATYSLVTDFRWTWHFGVVENLFLPLASDVAIRLGYPSLENPPPTLFLYERV